MQLSHFISVMDNKIANFEFVPGKTPLSTFNTVWYALAFYLLTIVVLTRLMSNREPIKLRAVVSVHNILLTSYSAISFVMLLRYLLPEWKTKGGNVLLCDPKNEIYNKGPLVFWFYLFYLSKMYEFLDTFFQCLRKKSLQFLHVWHHCITLVLCWVSIYQQHPMQTPDITANLLVHTVMYYYYYLCDKGVQVWWKKYITRLQIVQFVWDIVWHLAWFYAKNTRPVCNGGIETFHVGNLVVVSFLALFIRFYFQTYKSKGTKAA